MILFMALLLLTFPFPSPFPLKIPLPIFQLSLVDILNHLCKGSLKKITSFTLKLSFSVERFQFQDWSWWIQTRLKFVSESNWIVWRLFQPLIFTLSPFHPCIHTFIHIFIHSHTNTHSQLTHIHSNYPEIGPFSMILFFRLTYKFPVLDQFVPCFCHDRLTKEM